MKCNDVEKELQLDNITDDVKNHLDECEACRLYQRLITYNPIDIELDFNITSKINLAFDEANHVKKKHDILSLLLFIVIASTLVSALFLINIETTEKIIVQYVIIISAVMPFTLPLIALLRRKVVSNDN